MKYSILIIALLAGGFIGQFKTTNKTEFIRKSQDCHQLKRIENKTDLNSESSCPLAIPNMGLLHNRSEAVSKSKIYEFFSADLRKYYENPNEFNVHTNDSAAGKSAQKYDPREDLYVRFERTSKFDKKTNYGVVQDFPKSSKCIPSFNKIDDVEKNLFFKVFKGKEIKSLPDLNETPHRYSFLYFAEYFSFFNKEEAILKRYSFFRNTCSKAVSVILNFCLSDPRYDLQYEDMFVLESGITAESLIYCKKSSEKEWVLISKADYKLVNKSEE